MTHCMTLQGGRQGLSPQSGEASGLTLRNLDVSTLCVCGSKFFPPISGYVNNVLALWVHS